MLGKNVIGATYIGIVAAAFALGAPAAADVLADHDNGPFTGIFGLPNSTEGSNLLTVGQYEFSVSSVVASHNIDEMVGIEGLALDGETSRLGVTYRYGVNEKLEIAVEVPYVWHQSGGLDSIIDSWHSFFGLPDGPRAVRARDQLQFLYVNDGNAIVNLTENSAGVGDVSILAGWSLSANSALRFRVKLPTGNGDRLLGSGGTDISVGLAGDKDSLWGNSRVNGFYRASVVFVGEPDLLRDRYKDFVGQLSAGVGFSITPSIELRAQAKIRSALYDSRIENLGDVAASLTFGGDFKLSDRISLSLAVGEDIKPDSAPDVSFLLGFRYQNTTR